VRMRDALKTHSLRPSVFVGPVIACVVVRLLFILINSDLSSTNYWEYGVIAQNLRAGTGYSLFVATPDTVAFDAGTSGRVLPSAFMPPGYPVFLYPFFGIEGITTRNFWIQAVQTLLAAGVTLLLIMLTGLKFGSRPAKLAGWISVIQPDMIYAVASYTPTIISQILVLIILVVPALGARVPRARQAVFLGILLGLLVLVRSEAALFAILVFGALLVTKEYRAVLLGGLVFLAVLAPWQVRNAIVFGRPVPGTTSLGLNLYRGHNPVGIGNWTDARVQAEVRGLKGDTGFEPAMSDLYMRHAFSAMADNGWREISLSAQKLLRFWILDIGEARSLHPLYMLLWLPVLFAAIGGLGAAWSWRLHWPEFLFLAASSAIVVLFFPLPRYQTMMKVALLPFAGFWLANLVDRSRRNFAQEGVGMSSL
jgi:hypothetical protein